MKVGADANLLDNDRTTLLIYALRSDIFKSVEAEHVVVGTAVFLQVYDWNTSLIAACERSR